MRSIHVHLVMAAVVLALAACAGDGRKSRASCDVDADCTSGVCFQSQCYTACTQPDGCAADELCVAKARDAEVVTLCVVAADYAPCATVADCHELVFAPCRAVACHEGGACGYDTLDDGTYCDGPDRPGFCQAGTCITGDTCGNGACTAGETCAECPEDCCAVDPFCGDGDCAAGEEDDCFTDCPQCSTYDDCLGWMDVGPCEQPHCQEGRCYTTPEDDGAYCQQPSEEGWSEGTCVNQQCVVCTPDCAGKECGDDGCGGSCGTCGDGLACSPDFTCSTCCTDVCGDGTCGGDETCASCPDDCTGCPAVYQWTFDDAAYDGFTSDVSADPWQAPVMVTAVEGGGSFLGPFGKQTVHLVVGSSGTFAILPPVTLPTGPLPQHDTVRLTFDLLVLGSWDGHAATDGSTYQSMPDTWTWGVPDQEEGQSYSFANCAEDVQTWPEPYAAGATNATNAAKSGATSFDPIVTFEGTCGDATYHLTFTFAHAAASLDVLFLGNPNEYPNARNLSNESWGLDNVTLELLCQACGG
jgi:hypothetical protein